MNRRVVGGAVGVGLLVAAPVALWAVVRFVVAPRVVAAVEAAAERAFDADVAVTGVTFDAFGSLPRVAVGLSSLTVTGRAPFEGVQLLSLGESRIELDLLAILSSRYEIEGLRLTRPELRVVVLPDGRSNLDTFLGAAEPTDDAAPPTVWALDRAEVTDLVLTVDDAVSGAQLGVHDLDASLSASGGSATTLALAASVADLDLASGGVTWLTDGEGSARLDLTQAADGQLTFGDNEVKLNGLALALTGTVMPGESTRWDLAFSSPDTSLAGLVSLLPGAKEAVGGATLTGTTSFRGSTKGAWPAPDGVWPALELDAAVVDGSFRFPGQPGLERLSLDLGVRREEGPLAATSVDARSFALTVAGQSLTGAFSLTDPTGDPDVRATLRGGIDLGAVRSTWPAATAATPTGKLGFDLELAARLSQLTARSADQVTCRGTVSGEGVHWTSEGWPELVVERFETRWSPEAIDVADTRVTWRGSDTRWSGRLEGLVPWVLRDETLVGRLSLDSDRLDLRPFQGQPGEGDTDPGGAIAVVPSWADLVIEARVGHLVTEEFTMRDLSGRVTVKGGEATFDAVEASMLGGRVTLEGAYSAPDPSRGDLRLAVTGVALDLGDSLQMFETLSALAPVLRGAKSTYGTRFWFTAPLAPDGTPDLAVMTSKGTFSPAAMDLAPAALKDVSNQLAPGRGTALLEVGPGLAWQLENGRVDLVSSAIRFAGRAATLSGSAGVVDHRLDLEVKTSVPSAALAALPLPTGTTAGEVPLVVRIGGTFESPRVGLSVDGATAGELVEAAVGQVAEDLTLEARAEADALLAEARKQADRLTAEARKQADELRKAADKQGRELLAKAKGDPIATMAAKEANQQLQRQAKLAGDKLVQEAEKAGDRLVGQAEKQAEALTPAPTSR